VGTDTWAVGQVAREATATGAVAGALVEFYTPTGGRRMKIIAVETIPVQVPIDPRRAIRGGRGYHLTSPFLIVKVHTDEGLTGLGEVSCTPGWSGEDQVTAAHFIADFLAPLLAGEDPTAIGRLTAKLGQGVAGNPFTKAALEMALWDLLGKSVGLPVYRLLGGAVRDFVPTKFSVSGLEPVRAAELAAWAVGQGFRTMKVKVGIEPEADVARVRAVREAIGPEVRLGVDANGGWSPRVAIQTIRRLYDYGIYFAEQPVPALDVAWLADVRNHVAVPVMADESVYTLQDAMAVVRAGAADVLSVYVGKGGGIGPARKIAAVAEAAGLTCTVGSNLELGVASAAMIHLALATPGIGAEEFPCDILSPFFYEDTLLAEPLPIVGGAARPFERPGLGVELDDEKVERFRAD
jgi:muconate cycloisomerase